MGRPARLEHRFVTPDHGPGAKGPALDILAALEGFVVRPSRSSFEASITTTYMAGYRVSALMGEYVVNDQKEQIGTIDDFVVGRDDPPVFAVLQVGDFLGPGGNLVAVPFPSLELGGPRGKIVLPGATRAALAKLPAFE